jgi:hypothetical protein
MRPTLKIPAIQDIDVPLAQVAAESRRRRSSNRFTLEAPPERRRGKSPWKVVEERPGGTADWEVTTDLATGVTTHREIHPRQDTLRPAYSGDAHCDLRGASLWTFVLIDDCVIGHQGAAKGDLVVCGNSAAADLLASGRGKLIEERRQ